MSSISGYDSIDNLSTSHAKSLHISDQYHHVLFRPTTSKRKQAKRTTCVYGKNARCAGSLPVRVSGWSGTRSHMAGTNPSSASSMAAAEGSRRRYNYVPTPTHPQLPHIAKTNPQ